ncbi:hypothetical protein HK405_015183, partial [Cladochytrium tenue]
MIPAGLANRYLARRALVVVFMNSYLKKYGPPPVHHAPPRGSPAIAPSASSLAMTSAAASRSPSLDYVRRGSAPQSYNPAATARPPPLPSIATDSIALSSLPNIPDYSPNPSSSASNLFYLSQSPPAVFMNPTTSTAAATTASSSVASRLPAPYLDRPVAPEPRTSFASSAVYRRRSSPISFAAKPEVPMPPPFDPRRISTASELQPAASRPSFEHVDRRPLTAASSTDGPPSPSPPNRTPPNVTAAAAAGRVQLVDTASHTPGTSTTTIAEAIPSPRPSTLPRAAPRPHRHSAAAQAAVERARVMLPLDAAWVALAGGSAGVAMATRDVSGAPIPAVRGDAKWSGFTILEALSVIKSFHARQTWDARFDGGRIVEHLNLDDLLAHTQQKGTFPVSGRDLSTVSRMHYEDGLSANVIHTSTSVIDPACPEDPKRVRADLALAAWVLRRDQGSAAAADGTAPIAVSYIVQVDIKGSVPASLIKAVQAQTPMCIAEVANYLAREGPLPFLVRHILGLEPTPNL